MDCPNRCPEPLERTDDFYHSSMNYSGERKQYGVSEYYCIYCGFHASWTVHDKWNILDKGVR